MAGQAAKKIKKAAESGAPRYIAAAVLSWLWFVGMTYYRDRSIAWLTGPLLAVVSWVSVKMIVEALTWGLPFDYWQDLFFVTVAAEIAGGLHYYGLLLWLVVPGYIVAFYGKQVIEYLQSRA